MPYPVSFNFTLPPPPNGFSGNLAQVFSLIQQTLQGSLAQDAAVLGQGTVLPTSDVGPFIFTGIDPPALYTWSTVSSSYVPSALPAGTPVVSPNQLFAWFGGLNTAVTPNQINVNWAQIIGVPNIAISGTTATMNSLSANNGQLFYNTDIGALMVYNSGTWITADGNSGDVKFVVAPTLAAALLKNPGWTQNTSATDRVLIAAGNLYGEASTGGGSVTLAQNQLPASLTNITLNPTDGGDGGSGAATRMLTASNSTPNTSGASDNMTLANSGGGQPTPTIPPYIAYWCLLKS